MLSSRSILKNRSYGAVFNDATEIPITGAHQDYSSHPALTILYSTNVRQFFHEVGLGRKKSTALCKKEDKERFFHRHKWGRVDKRPATRYRA